jgi:Tat protein secretion system quality control protein TatD with DNase activity
VSFRSIAKRIAYRASVVSARVAWATLDLKSTWVQADKELTQDISEVLCNRRNMLAMAELMVTMDRVNRKESIAALTKIAKTLYADLGFDPAKPTPDSQSAMFEFCRYMRQDTVVALCLHELGKASTTLLRVWLTQTQQKLWLQALKFSALTLTQSHKTVAEVYQVSLRA